MAGDGQTRIIAERLDLYAIAGCNPEDRFVGEDVRPGAVQIDERVVESSAHSGPLRGVD